MSWEPIPPKTRHVWVRERSGHGTLVSVVIVDWQHTPSRSATDPAWTALVALAPFRTALLVQWASSDRLVPVLDDTPADSTQPGRHPQSRGLEANARPARRHAWLHGGPDIWRPSLVLEWRHTPSTGWEAHTASVQQQAVLLDWAPAARLRPVNDDRHAAGS